MKIAGRRIGPAEVEGVALETEGILAVAAVGLPDGRHGEALYLFVVGQGDAFESSVAEHVVARLGKAFRPAGVFRVPDLPRTRNNKIMRRVIRKIALGEGPGDLSSLENPNSIAGIPRIARTFG
jgi:acetyl-CoA synthetase